jgi:hypothetical protein
VTGGDSTLQTYDNRVANLKTSHTRLSLCGETAGPYTPTATFVAFYTQELVQSDFVNWYASAATVAFTDAYTDHAHSVGEGDSTGIFPLGFTQVFYEKNNQEMTLRITDHGTYLHGHIDGYNTLSQTLGALRDVTFYTEPNGWPNNQTGPNADWWILN